MPLKKNRERIVNNPLENRNVGRRTGKNITAGKNIRKVAGGFENFDDYWSESEADMTREVTFVKPSTPMDVTAMKKGEACDVRPQQPSLAPPVKHLDSQSSVLVQSQAGNIEPGRDALNPFTSKQIGRRTWKDMKAGKNIRVFDGFENFDDYWSESDAESVASFCTTTSNKSKADKKSSVPSKTTSNTDTREEKQKSSNNETYGNKKDSSRVSGTFGDKTDTGKTGKDQMKTAVTSLHNQETNKESPPQDDQTEVSSTEETYSQESSTLAKDVDSQEEKDTEEDSGQEGTQGQQTDNAEEVLEEEYSQEEKLAKTRGKPDNINLEPPKEIPVSDKGKELPNEKRQKKRSKSNLFTELHTDSTADSNQPGTSTKKTSVGATSQECTTLAVEESGSSRKAKLCESSSKQPKSPAKEESKQTNSKLEAKKFKGNTTLETSDARERAVESSFDGEGSEQSEETPQSHKGSEQKEKVSGSGAKKLRVSEQKTGKIFVYVYV
ncbi:uncharacterized protein LOC143280379 [Babylonia areolata]|uniref:uncharacterized protein LOC143280379 n=1 Tax=Babylonia areolata TaxID=304850 RepID=UPI003FD122C6